MSRLKEAIAEALKAFAPPPRLSVSEWADKERFLSPESSAEPGRWITSRAPYQREIMDAAKDPAVEEIVVMMSAQVGKTEIINNMLGYFSHHDPAPMLLVQPTLGMAGSYSKDRLAPMIRDSPALSEIFGDAKSKSTGNTLLHKKFPGGHITLAGSNSPASLASRPVRIVFFDEVDRFPPSAGTEGDPVSLGRKRTTTFFNKLCVMVSTPTIKKASRIELAWETSDQRRYLVPCPGCGMKFAMRFSEAGTSHEFWKNVKHLCLKWEKDRPETAHFVCDSCGLVMDHSNKRYMLENGEWVKGQPGITKVAGFHLNELYSPWRTWGDVALDFLRAKRNPETLKTFINTSLGESWEIQGDSPDWKKLYDRRESYKLNELPPGVRFLTCGVDVQKNRIELEIVGWGYNLESWSIDYRTFLGDTSKPEAFVPLDDIMHELWIDGEGKEIPILRLAIDSGYQANMVYKWAKKYPASRVMVIKGVDDLNHIFETPKKGKKKKITLKDKEGVPVWRLGVSVIKREIYGWLKQEIPNDEEISELGYPYGFSHFPKDYPEEYFKMLTAEVEDVKLIRGFPHYMWVKRYNRNEALDCRVYNRAAAATLGIDRSDNAVQNLSAKSRMQAKKDPTKPIKRKIVRTKSSYLG